MEEIKEILLRIEKLLIESLQKKKRPGVKKSPGRPVANPIDWKLAFEIWSEKKREYITYKQLSNIYHISVQTLQKICTGQSPAEKEYIKQTGDAELKGYLKWREKQYEVSPANGL